DEFDLARGSVARGEGRHVPNDRGQIPPPLLAERRHRPDPDAQVVGTAPDRQVVPRAELAAAVDTAEVRRLVPTVPRAGQRVDDALGMALHRLRLAGELVSVRVREP